jgi:hypothetical protein
MPSAFIVLSVGGQKSGALCVCSFFCRTGTLSKGVSTLNIEKAIKIRKHFAATPENHLWWILDGGFADCGGAKHVKLIH